MTSRIPFTSIWFDCDSTLSTVEGIDELARARDSSVFQAVASLTNRAMAGELPLEAVYQRRLETIAPTRCECARLAERYIATALPDAKLVLTALRSLGKTVGIVSGGLRSAVLPFAEHLGVPEAFVRAVEIRFTADGAYLGLAADQPLARSGGKIEVLRAIPSSQRPLALCGDGVTDLEAAVATERFVGFGGVVRRDAVADHCAHFADGPGLASTLPHLLTTAEVARLSQDPRFAQLIAG
ncbi:MAG: HAD-IB family phosphatase [Planctomycetota bacterium]